MRRTFAVSSLLTSRWFTNIFAPFVCTAHKKEKYKAQQEVINKRHTSSERNDIMASSGHKWLEKKKEGFLLDVYGVAYNCGNRTSTITGSREAIDLLRKAGIPFRFCSNTSSKTADEVLVDLKKMNFDVKDGEIFTPVSVAKEYIEQHKLRPFLLVDQNVEGYFSSLDQSEPNCVLLGEAKDTLSFANINKAFNILSQHPDHLLITLGTGKYYKETEGMFLGCGPFAVALEYATGKKALCIGKPSAEYFKTALDSMGLEASQAVMVGDDIVGDVEGAQKAGMCGVQVRTGKFRASDEPHVSVVPDGYVDNLHHAVTLFLRHYHPGVSL